MVVEQDYWRQAWVPPEAQVGDPGRVAPGAGPIMKQ